LLYSYKSTNTDAEEEEGLEEEDRYELYLLYSYKSTNTDAEEEDSADATDARRYWLRDTLVSRTQVCARSKPSSKPSSYE
jgi:hypothetical protein